MNPTLNNAIGIAQLIDNPLLIDIAEFGVFSGSTISQLRQNFPLSTPIYGFDTFTGLPEDWEGTTVKKGDFDLNGNIPNIPGVIFYKGIFKDTIPKYLKVAKPLKILHIDCDLYSSTQDVLYSLNHLILPGTIIVFDEWYYNGEDIFENRQHEQKCFYEWVIDKNRNYIIFNANIGDQWESQRRIILITK
jgi:hypothetical protein